ncbi:uncharacterized protein DUF1298 [Motilibacter peucedani]|uniref:Uncharacterized protein DUF1298 n=1 Tax=Motilibacter peucedani TaxID=598650 RepID=A0A420XJS6_9ACTN|nr:phosphatase PAP2 family protein [Motilibacter peucedani]RKS67984.1 uncharacterized protein DUF1298 [Motilibacter peucedani]
MAPVTRPPWRRELALGLAVFAVYSVVSGLDWSGRRQTAEDHAHRLRRLEHALHLDPERALNSWLAPHSTLRVLANYEYATTYVISSFALLFWLWWRRPETYRWARTSFVVLNLLGVACFALWPLMPPRLLPGSGIVDTVRLGRTWGSWGSPLVSHANELAAMPSLHLAWAMWVSAVLALIAGGRRTQVLSALHVLLTLFVILATGNHFLLDAVAGAVLVWLSTSLTAPDRVAAPDLFFLRVETPAAPQHVGGVVLLDTSERPAPTLEQVRGVVRSALPALPRFRQRLTTDSAWRRPRWVEDATLELDRHVELRTVEGEQGFLDLVGELAGSALPRDRPLWRVVLVHGLAPDRAALVLLVHHVVADGIGVVAQARLLLEPPPGPAAAPGRDRRPGMLARAGATVVGLAQLATDGRPRLQLPGGGPSRAFATVVVPMEQVRRTARAHGARVTDVLLSAVAGGLSRAGVGEVGELRAAVPLMVRRPGAEGNATSAVMVDVPLGPQPEDHRLRQVAARTGRLRTPTRALASRFVQQRVGALLPARAHAAFARAVYGPGFLQAVVSNMPGADERLALAGAPLLAAFPLVPLAPGTAVGVGALGWDGDFCIGVGTDPGAVDAGALAAGVAAVLDELAAQAEGDQASASTSRARTAGSWSESPKRSWSWPMR